jgi:hypothetical protein
MVIQQYHYIPFDNLFIVLQNGDHVIVETSLDPAETA